jgi:polyphosphate kinase 2 (PPK2 family)
MDMGKTRKSAEPEESVLRDAREVNALEHLADRPKPRKPPKDYKYLDELAHLQFELIKLQEWVRLQGLRVVALGTPRDRERGQWYYQR